MHWVNIYSYLFYITNGLNNGFLLYKIAVCLPDDPEGNAKLMLSILDCLPRANRVIYYS